MHAYVLIATCTLYFMFFIKLHRPTIKIYKFLKCKAIKVYYCNKLSHILSIYLCFKIRNYVRFNISFPYWTKALLRPVYIRRLAALCHKMF